MEEFYEYWAARDKDGTLWVYRGKPERFNDIFIPSEIDEDGLYNNVVYADYDPFPKLTFENSPLKVNLKDFRRPKL